MSVSRETEDRLARFEELLRQWSPRINLISPTTLDDLRHRHIVDSLQLIDLRPEPGPAWVDLGSGGGLPGLVAAIALQGSGTAVTLIEADQRKATFLRQAIRVLSLSDASVLTTRIEAASPQAATTISARALAPLSTLMAYVARHLRPDGTALLMKGRRWQSEVDEAQAAWSFDLTAHGSITEPGAAVLEVRNIHAR